MCIVVFDCRISRRNNRIRATDRDRPRSAFALVERSPHKLIQQKTNNRQTRMNCARHEMDCMVVDCLCEWLCVCVCLTVVYKEVEDRPDERCDKGRTIRMITLRQSIESKFSLGINRKNYKFNKEFAKQLRNPTHARTKKTFQQMCHEKRIRIRDVKKDVR